MLKCELEEENRVLKEQIEDLQHQLELAEEWGGEQEQIACELNKKIQSEQMCCNENTILDLNNFIHRLKLNNLYTEEMINFIEEYTKFYNN